MSDGTVVPFRRALRPEERALLDDPDFRMAVAELAGHYVGRVRGAVGYDDFFQAGMEGASIAALRFNPEKGSFKTYAWYDVRGGMTRLIGEGVAAQRVLDEGARGFLAEVRDDALPEDEPEVHQLRLADFSEGLFASIALRIYSEYSRAAATMGAARAEAEERLLIEAIHEVLTGLSEVQRTVLERVDMGGEPLKALVGQPGFPSYITARRIHARAKAAFRDALAERGFTGLPGARDAEEHAAGIRRRLGPRVDGE